MENDILLPEQDSEVILLRDQSTSIVEAAKSIQITDEASEKSAADYLLKAKSTFNSLEKKRKEFVDPLNKSLKTINGFFKMYTEPMKEVETIIKRKISVYRISLEQARQAEAAELAKQLQAPVAEVQEMMAATPTTVRTESGSVSTRKVTKFRVSDWKLVPAKYFVFDERLVREDIKLGITEIPGIEIYQEDEVVARA